MNVFLRQRISRLESKNKAIEKNRIAVLFPEPDESEEKVKARYRAENPGSEPKVWYFLYFKG